MVCTLVGDKVLLCSLIPGAEMRLHGLARGWGVLSLHHPLPLKDPQQCSSEKRGRSELVQLLLSVYTDTDYTG